MNPELYTEEFRNFKYLKSTPAAVEYFRKTQIAVNRIRPEDQEENNDFSWSSRIEFVEQIMDLRNEDLYIVIPGEPVKVADPTVNTKVQFGYDVSRLIHIKNPVIFEGHPMKIIEGREITIDDVNILDSNPTADFRYYLCADMYMDVQRTSDKFGSTIYTITGLGLVPVDYISYTAMFYDSEEARKYRDATTKYLRKNAGAISAISRLI
jgi:hypothetical protein